MYNKNAEGRVLHGLNCDPADDILIRLDRAGFVVNASANLARLGFDLESLLVMPHLADFAVGDHREHVLRYFEQAIAGGCEQQAIEFPVRLAGNGDEEEDEPGHWYALDLTPIEGGASGTAGALGTLHSVQHKHAIVQHPQVDTATDPVTGLANRRSFLTSLTAALAQHEAGSIAIFAIDGMRAIFMQYGQSTADEIRWGFARFLQTMTEPHQILAQIDEERFGIILPGMQPRVAREWAADTLQTFSGLAAPSGPRGPDLSASAGIARVDASAEWTLRQAELGLVMARAGGGMQTGFCRPVTNLSCGSEVERAMEAAVQRALDRYS